MKQPRAENIKTLALTFGASVLGAFGVSIKSNQIKSNQKQIYIAPYVASESAAHGGHD